jgi:hypothetical protein
MNIHPEHASHYQRTGTKFLALGAAQVAAGIFLHNDSLRNAGFHNIGDGPVFHARHAGQEAHLRHEHGRGDRLRRRAAAVMVAFGVGLVGYELVNPSESSERHAVVIALAGVETAITAVELRKTARHKAQTPIDRDSLIHLGLDMVGCAFTVAGAVGAVNERIDTFGALGNAGVLTLAGLYSLLERPASDHEFHCD